MQYFQALANHIDMAILVYTPDGQIEWINDADQTPDTYQPSAYGK